MLRLQQSIPARRPSLRSLSSCGRLALFTLAFCCAPVGCGFVPKTQFNACESQARILNEQSQAQLAEIANLKAHSRKLEDQLLKAEKDLAGLEQRTAADQKRLTNFQVERQQVQEQIDDLVRGAKLTGIAPVRDDDVERLTKRFPMLRFDPLTGAYKLDVDVLFDGDGTRIAPESEKLLTELASLFAEPEAKELRVFIVGRSNGGAATAAPPKPATAAGETPAIDHRRSTERALAVAEFLRKVGLQGERIGVGGVGAGGERPAVESAKSRRVEIFVMGKRTPIVGWDTPAAGRF